MVKLTIDNIPVEVPENTSILDAAKSVHINIPTLCYLKELNEIGACRICCVEIKGYERLVPSCDTKVAEGMEVFTNSPKVRSSRLINLRLILSQHNVNCTHCPRNGNCTLQSLASDFNILRNYYDKQLKNEPIDYSTPLIRDNDKCIKCMRCIQVCENIQTVNIWDLLGTGSRVMIHASNNRKIQDTECTYCGQCITHCPVGALTERSDIKEVFRAIDDPEITTVVQVAPAVRAAWAEHYNLDPSFATPERMAAALRKIGFDYVFDTNFSADLTIMEEGSEFIERFTHKDQYKWPMFTSCCPGWVRFLKSQYPELTDNLSTAKSPQQMLGPVAKTYFAEKIGVDPHKIKVISVMPCVAKKAECAIPNLNDACGDPDVDIAITTREFNNIMRQLHIDPMYLPEDKFDSPLGEGTGAAVIFGATGGVMDAALRSAYFLITGKNPEADTFKSIRGIKGWKESTFEIPGAGEVKIAVASGLGNARKLIEALKRKEVEYDFVEIMACPGGCAGGGGQPIHDGMELADTRGNILWGLDKNCKVRYSHENSEVLQLYKEYLEKPLSEKAHHLLHTNHHGWEMVPALKKEK